MFNLTEVQQSNYVTIDENGKTTTTSLKVAEFFNKNHAHVLRDIDQILTQVSDSFRKSNFGFTQIDTIMPTGGIRKDRIVILTEAGFMMLAMGYTGEAAMKIKEAYITEFENMREFVDTKRNEYISFQEAKNEQLVNETTTILKNVENNTRKLATSAINLNCDIGIYRQLFKLHREKEAKLNQSRRKAKQSQYNVMEGNLDFLLEQLAFRVEYDRSEEAVAKLDALLAARYRSKQFTSYHDVKTAELIDKLVSELQS